MLQVQRYGILQVSITVNVQQHANSKCFKPVKIPLYNISIPLQCNNYGDYSVRNGTPNECIFQDDEDAVYLDKLQTRGVKKSILYI
jgi:hypothetical protein